MCLTTPIYPSRTESAGVEVFADVGAADLQHLEAWQLRSIWAWCVPAEMHSRAENRRLGGGARYADPVIEHK